MSAMLRQRSPLGCIAAALLNVFSAAFGLASVQAQPAPPASPAPVVTLEYDAQGNPRRTIIAPAVADIITSHDYDRLNRRFKTTDARGKATSIDYNGREDPVRVTDPRNLITQYPRNGLGDATSLVSPDTGTAAHTYDAAGNLKTRQDSRGVLATHDHDALNRLSAINYTQAGQPSQSFVWGYDQTGLGFSYGVGRLTSTQYPAGSTTQGYDAQGRLVRSTQTHADAGITLVVAYGLDAAGHITSITYPSGRVLYIPHSGGVPSSVSLAPSAGAAALPLLSQIQTEPALGGSGQMRAWLWHLDSGTQAHERSFDTSGRMVRYPLGGALRDIRYDAADRIRAYSHLDRSSGTSTAAAAALNQNFGYDALGRLTGVVTSIGSWAYGYDDNGNRTLLTQTTSGSTVTRNHTIDAGSNRLLVIDNPNRRFSHDPAGNIDADRQGVIQSARSHDLQGRLSRTRYSGDGRYFSTTVFGYNAAGQRVLKHTQVIEDCGGGVISTCRVLTYPNPIFFVYDATGFLLGEYDGYSGATLREYVWLQGMPVAVVDGPAVNPSVAYLHTDHIDTPRVVIDRQGRQRWSWVAEPFGNSAPVTNPVGVGDFALNLRMPGQYFDVETGLSQNWHRVLDHGLGRYTQSDPIGLAGGINTYAYVGGNPVSRVDPDGRLFFVPPLVWWGAGAIGVGGAAWWATTTPPKMSLPSTPAAPYCKVDEFDKKICDDNFERDQDACHVKFGGGFRGGGFASNLRGCLSWAEVRRNACYRGERDPGPYRGGDSWPGGRNR